MYTENDRVNVFLDECSPGRIRGWCWIPTHPDWKLVVTLLDISGIVLHQQSADIFRQDLVDCCASDGKHAFDFQWDFFSGDAVSVLQFSYPNDISTAIYLTRMPISFPQPDYQELKIHPDDLIFKFLLKNFGANNIDGAVKYYFEDGNNSAKALTRLVNHRIKGKKKLDLLEFASGYGCVTRHMNNKLFNCTSCDINAAALKHIQENFGVKTLESDSDPTKFSPNAMYDVVFALSFFSHIPDHIFGKWLGALYKCVRKGGVLIFTTHGNVSNDKFFKFTLRNGFYCNSDSKQEALDSHDYETTISTNAYVAEVCKNSLGKLPDDWIEGFWWEHQDVYFVRK